MHESHRNVIGLQGTYGKSRKAKNTAFTRHIRFDRDSDNALWDCAELLQGNSYYDTVSNGIVVRRAVTLYLGHLLALKAKGQLDQEKQAARKKTRMPKTTVNQSGQRVAYQEKETNQSCVNP